MYNLFPRGILGLLCAPLLRGDGKGLLFNWSLKNLELFGWNVASYLSFLDLSDQVPSKGRHGGEHRLDRWYHRACVLGTRPVQHAQGGDGARVQSEYNYSTS